MVILFSHEIQLPLSPLKADDTECLPKPYLKPQPGEVYTHTIVTTGLKAHIPPGNRVPQLHNKD